MKILIDLYARPLTKEQFLLDYTYLDYDLRQDWSESVHIFLSDAFWDYFEDKFDNKSIYKVVLIIDITLRGYYDRYFGTTEYDEDVEVTDVFIMSKARSFSELRGLVRYLKDTKEIM